MGGWLALIPFKARVVLIGSVLFLLALVGIRVAIRQEAFKEVERKRTQKRLDTIIESERIEDEVEDMDDDALIRAASRWVR